MSHVKYSVEMNEHMGIQISPGTVRRRVNDTNMDGRIASGKNKKRHMAWTRNLLQSPISTWNNVIWIDESKFNLFRSDWIVREYDKNLGRAQI